MAACAATDAVVGVRPISGSAAAAHSAAAAFSAASRCGGQCGGSGGDGSGGDGSGGDGSGTAGDGGDGGDGGVGGEGEGADGSGFDANGGGGAGGSEMVLGNGDHCFSSASNLGYTSARVHADRRKEDDKQAAVAWHQRCGLRPFSFSPAPFSQGPHGRPAQEERRQQGVGSAGAPARAMSKKLKELPKGGGGRGGNGHVYPAPLAGNTRSDTIRSENQRRVLQRHIDDVGRVGPAAAVTLQAASRGLRAKKDKREREHEVAEAQRAAIQIQAAQRRLLAKKTAQEHKMEQSFHIARRAKLAAARRGSIMQPAEHAAILGVLAASGEYSGAHFAGMADDKEGNEFEDEFKDMSDADLQALAAQADTEEGAPAAAPADGAQPPKP